MVERHQVSNTAALRYLVRRFTAAPARLFSINRFYRDLRSQGLRIGKDTLHAYLRHLEDSFLVFTLPVHTRSERARMVNPRKAYLADPGLAIGPAHLTTRDLGFLLENAVYLVLRRRGFDLAYVNTASGREIHFLARAPGAAPLLVQVCADASDPDTRRRELQALEEAMQAVDAPQSLVITLHEAAEERIGGRLVRFVPGWRWFLEDGMI